jgi:hypothetical protein
MGERRGREGKGEAFLFSNPGDEREFLLARCGRPDSIFEA